MSTRVAVGGRERPLLVVDSFEREGGEVLDMTVRAGPGARTMSAYRFRISFVVMSEGDEKREESFKIDWRSSGTWFKGSCQNNSGLERTF